MQQRRRNGDNGAIESLNHAMVRLRTTFVDLGGDFRNPTHVDTFAGLVQNRTVALPPRQRWAFELVSAAAGAHPYPEIIATLRRQGIEVKERTLRRLVERAISRIEDDFRARPWSRSAGSANEELPPGMHRTRGDR